MPKLDNLIYKRNLVIVIRSRFTGIINKSEE
jgi:hypothetical protein